MEITQTSAFSFPREQVWEKLMDFDVLAKTLPGIDSLDPIDAETCRLAVKVMIPSITGNYEGTVRIIEKQPIDSYRLQGEAKGRLGWVKGDARFSLAESEGGGTAISATMSFQTGGAIAGVGQRFMQAIAKGMVRDFFSAFGKQLESAGPS